MALPITSKARLRTRSGCLTCRRRRVKCTEERPICCDCAEKQPPRYCVWPGDQGHETPDGRLRAQRKARDSQEETRLGFLDLPSSNKPLSIAANATFPDVLTPEEAFLIRHHNDVFSEILTLPTGDPRQIDEWRSQLDCMIAQAGSVRHAVIAASAANKAALSKDRKYEAIALDYYTSAVQLAANAVRALDDNGTVPGDEILVTVMYLYVHDLWGMDPEFDARKHVAGAVNLIRLGGSHRAIAPAWNRIILESVLFQALYLAIRRPTNPDFKIDPGLLTNYRSLGSEPWLAELEHGTQSPVLGLPLELYGHIVSVVELHSARETVSKSQLDVLQTQVEAWERLAFPGGLATILETVPLGFRAQSLALYVLAASLLLTQSRAQMNQKISSHASWQLSASLGTMRRPDFANGILSSYLGAWPLFVVGKFTATEEDSQIIRQGLCRLVERSGYGEAHRMLNELEILWSQRNEGRKEQVIS